MWTREPGPMALVENLSTQPMRTVALSGPQPVGATRLPQPPGFEVAARYVPAAEGHGLGGDFYDLFSTRPGEWVAVIGDVCGKGAGAAAMTALARYALRAGAAREESPAAVLRGVNVVLLRDESVHRHCTAVFARLLEAPGPAALTCASGGHPLPLLVRAGGRVEQLGECGTLLGAVADVHVSDASALLAKGDSLVLYTDGVTDAQAPDRIVSEQELSGALAQAAGQGAEALAAAAERVARAGGGRRPRDDLAVLVLRRV